MKTEMRSIWPLLETYPISDEMGRLVGTITYSPSSPDVNKFRCWRNGEMIGETETLDDAEPVHKVYKEPHD